MRNRPVYNRKLCTLTVHKFLQIFHFKDRFVSDIPAMSLQHSIYLIADSLLDVWIHGQLVQTELQCG